MRKKSIEHRATADEMDHKTITIDSLPSKGKFYDASMRIKIRSLESTPKVRGRSKQVDGMMLDLYLNSPRKRGILPCWHDWIYWTFGNATRSHRVCSKCYKKQQNMDAVVGGRIWIKDESFPL